MEYSDYVAISVGIVLRGPNDYSAVALVGVESDEQYFSANRFVELQRRFTYDVIDVRRFQKTPYGEIIKQGKLLATISSFDLIEIHEVTIDASETGFGVLDSPGQDLGEITVTAVMLTEDRLTHQAEGYIAIPRREVVTALLDTMTSRRLRVGNFETTRPLAAELERIDLKRDKDDPYDAMASAVALALWRAQYLNRYERIISDGITEEHGPKDRAVWDPMGDEY